ncbi:MAG: MaoC family dehydratase [Bacteroidales bacterium]|nr:MaoC family dehydratase [Bacteroidales bacterium]MCF8459039.1 MaoC family dehydratase [Bacteroidales bacterium]
MKKVKLNTVVEFKKTYTSEDLIDFARISEDNNPIHIDEEYAAKSIFEKRVVHGVLLAGMFSKIFGTIYPGNGTIYLSQSSKFLKPAYLNDLITAKVTLTSFDNEKKRGIFLTECFNESGALVLTGEAKILFPKTFELSTDEE